LSNGTLQGVSCWATSDPGSDPRLSGCYGNISILAILLQVVRSKLRSDWLEFTRGLLDRALPGLASAQARSAGRGRVSRNRGVAVDRTNVGSAAPGVRRLRFQQFYSSEQRWSSRSGRSAFVYGFLGTYTDRTGVGSVLLVSRKRSPVDATASGDPVPASHL
jgi:hypothetical protein